MTGRYEASLSSDNPHAVIALVLELSQVRSHWVVGRALTEAFPTEEEWQAAISSEAFLEMVDEFAQTIPRLRDLMNASVARDPEVVQRLFVEQYGKSLDAIKVFAEQLDVPPEDFLAVVVNTQGRLAGQATDQMVWQLMQRVEALEARLQG